MKILSASLKNFASYKELDFCFTNQGLTLIQGPTGSGKSTLCDAIPWVLFGTTAKGGAVSEVLSWPGDEVTHGMVVIQIGSHQHTIHRIRGSTNKHNDLIIYSPGLDSRGKDIPDTQRLINQRLGLTPDLYLAAAYFHEFSQTAQFFTTTAKNRRVICEQLVDLSLPIKLQEGVRQCKKDHETTMGQLKEEKTELLHSLSFLKTALKQNADQTESWKIKRKFRLLDLADKHANFEANKRQDLEKYIEAEQVWSITVEGDPVCSECGAVKAKNHKHNRYNPFTAKIDAVLMRENTYNEQLEYAKAEENPYEGMVEENRDKLGQKESQFIIVEQELDQVRNAIADLDLLSEIVADFRSILIQNTISLVESTTNDLLTKHFDAEIRIALSASDADKLEVEITKDGNLASYTQLSKGQRGILKLCFGVSVMKAVANHHGKHFSQIFFDEALDGLDENMKAKAFRLLSELALEYESVFVVEHSEALKPLFLNSYAVRLNNGASEIEKA